MANVEFGRRLFEARQDAGKRAGRDITKAEVGRALGVSGTAVGTWEKGTKEPTLATIGRLADVLGVSPEWLAFGTGGRDTPPTVRHEHHTAKTTVAEPSEGGAGGKRRRRQA